MPVLRIALRHRIGATLVEALLVLSLIGVLLALLLPAIVYARNLAARGECANRLRNLAIGVHLFESQNRRIPAGCGYPYLKKAEDMKRQAGFSWQTAILPFIDQNELGVRASLAQQQNPGVDNAILQHPIASQVVPAFLCPTESRTHGNNGTWWTWALTSYVGVAGSDIRLGDGVFLVNNSIRFTDISDGSSNTMMIGERPPGRFGEFSGWYAAWGLGSVCRSAQILQVGPTIANPSKYATDCVPLASSFRAGRLEDGCDLNHFWSLHSGGANFAFADGSVRFMSYAANDLLPALATRAGGEPVSFD